MDFDVLKSFIAVAEEKSFSLAAKHLFMSQQSLSKQISRLEEELGEPLFLRSRPLGLTTDGKLFLQTAKRILQLRFIDGRTQMEVSKEIGISQAQVSRLEKNAIDKIRG